MTKPSLSGFLTFIRDTMGISTDNLPDNADVIPMAYSVALEIVNDALAGASSLMYTLAVYNLAGDNLINYAPDPASPPGTANYFSSLRDKWNILKFVSGVVQSSSDGSSSNSLVVQEAAKNFTLGNLQNLKTPYGRTYLAIAQNYGPSVWGMN